MDSAENKNLRLQEYARALLDIGKGTGDLDLLESELKVFMEALYRAFTILVNDFRKQAYVEVVSAIELDQETIAMIKRDVDAASGLDVHIRNTVDGSIIGGLIIKMGGKVIDLSVRNKMEDIRARLKSVDLGGEGFGTED